MGKILIYIIAFMIILCVYIKLPRALRAIAFALNCIIPDPIPYVDEVVMVLGMIPR